MTKYAVQAFRLRFHWLYLLIQKEIENKNIPDRVWRLPVKESSWAWPSCWVKDGIIQIPR